MAIGQSVQAGRLALFGDLKSSKPPVAIPMAEERPLCEPWQLTFHKACLHILAVMVAGPLLLGGI